MPTPTKPYAVICNEKKSHRTKAELAQRKQAEEALKSDRKFKERKEVADNKFAHKEFLRIQKNLEKIEKNDALFEPVINRYCLLQAECNEMEERRSFIQETMKQLREEAKNLPEEDKGLYLLEITNAIVKLAGQLNSCDKLLLSKRKMLLDIEKENIMTIASALRSIPKDAEKKKSALQEALEM